MELKENKTKKWTGTYKGVGFEINNWQTPPNSIEPNEKDYWTYYIYLHLDRIPEENKPNSYWLKGRKDRNHVYRVGFFSVFPYAAPSDKIRGGFSISLNPIL